MYREVYNLKYFTIQPISLPRVVQKQKTEDCSSTATEKRSLNGFAGF